MVELTTTRLTFTVDAATYRRVEEAQATEFAAYDTAVKADHDPDFGRAQRVELWRELARARGDLLRAYLALASEMAPGDALLRPLGQAMNKLRERAFWDAQHANEIERREVSGDEERG